MNHFFSVNPTVHGGDIYSRRVEHDFSANINPLGMPESVKKAIVQSIRSFEHYPDVNCTRLREAIAAHDGFDTEKIVCGNGAADLIYRAVQVLSPKRALVAVPTFSEYERALLSFGCEAVHYNTRKEDNFSLREDFIDSIEGCQMVFVCNPNNPVGNLVKPELLRKIIEKCAMCGASLLIDECFMDFTGESPLSSNDLTGNVMLLRAFTKIYAMAGLRLGYMLCSRSETAVKIKSCGQCWSVSVPAQVAGAAALNERDYVNFTVELIVEERSFLTQALKESGFEVFDSSANFILFRCGMPLGELLMSEGFAIRDCRNYPGLSEGYYRIAVRGHSENQLLVEAIKRCVKNG